LYRNPSHDPTSNLSPEQLQEDFDLFYEDIFMELAKFGEIEEMVVCDNVGDHLVGNVYVQYHYEEQAGNAVDDLNKRFYAGRPLYAELSPVTDFREACCRQHEISECNRGGFCNFMHLKHPQRSLRRELFEAQKASIKEKKREERHADDRKARSSSPRHHKDDRRSERDDDQYQIAPEYEGGDVKRSRLDDGHEHRL